MGKTKIIVIQLKQIIKSGLFFVLGLILIAILIFMFIPKNHSQSQNLNPSSIYTPGKYCSQIILHNKPVQVEVSVDQNQILAINLNDISKSQEVFYPLFKPTMETLAREIIHCQSTNIPTINDYAITGKILISAVDNALQKAKNY